MGVETVAAVKGVVVGVEANVGTRWMVPNGKPERADEGPTEGVVETGVESAGAEVRLREEEASDERSTRRPPRGGL